MPKYILLICACVFFLKNMQAQNAIFLTQGRIEFEKKVSIYAIIDEQLSAEEDKAWAELEKKMSPQFKTTYFNLEFNGNKTLYKPGRENADNNKLREFPAEDNTVYTNLADSISIAQKHVFEQTFLVNDSTRKIKWKITDEMRNIAGFNCRRANAIVMDSIYIVAYYTDEITTGGGPESFNGLPGMILGLAMPHEHITWFATKVYTDEIPDAQLVPPTKGRKTNSKMLLSTLQGFMNDWGRWGKPYLREIML